MRAYLFHYIDVLSSILIYNQIGVPNFADAELEVHEVENLLDGFVNIEIKAGDYLSKSGENSHQSIYLQQDGKIQIIDEAKGIVTVLTKGASFGGTELSYIGPPEDYKSSITAMAMEDTKLFELDRAAIEKVLGSITRLGHPLPPAPSKIEKDMGLKDLILYQILGQGAFGRVWLCQHAKKPEKVYALKVMDKREIASRNMASHVVREKNVLASIDHPLVVNLVGAFQDDNSLYMVQDFLQGGELFTLLYENVSVDDFSNDAAVFYSACIIEALGHMHMRNISFRDLKPENVMLEANGYCVLIDMGFAKVVVEKTYTMCGSPEYMAPEILLGSGMHNARTMNWPLKTFPCKQVMFVTTCWLLSNKVLIIVFLCFIVSTCRTRKSCRSLGLWHSGL